MKAIFKLFNNIKSNDKDFSTKMKYCSNYKITIKSY